MDSGREHSTTRRLFAKKSLSYPLTRGDLSVPGSHTKDKGSVSLGGPALGPTLKKCQHNDVISWLPTSFPWKLPVESGASPRRAMSRRRAGMSPRLVASGPPDFKPISCNNCDENYSIPHIWFQAIWILLQEADLAHSGCGQMSGNCGTPWAFHTTN